MKLRNIYRIAGISAVILFALQDGPEPIQMRFEPDGSGLHAVSGSGDYPLLTIKNGRNWETHEVVLEDGRTINLQFVKATVKQPGESLKDVRRRVWDGYKGKSYEEWWESK